MAQIDGPQCPAVESIPGKVSGAWVFRDTRKPVSIRLIDSITEHFSRLASFPQLGRRRDKDLKAGVRSFPVGE
ncbi:MAG: type II toxin-antitoxin system RelE/ParE family toxin [Bryobacteraceae bacterium]|nr:type II toxin-antitoxin system RelE/ParE family toxin [Bryobacteraceae bacterium]